MANETDKKAFEVVSRTFDRSAMVLNKLAEDIIYIENNYGIKSKAALEKREQLIILRDLYDHTLGYINYLRKINLLQAQEFLVAEITQQQKNTGLTFRKIADLANGKLGNPGDWDKVDNWHRKITSIKEALQLSNDIDELDQFIKSL